MNDYEDEDWEEDEDEEEEDDDELDTPAGRDARRQTAIARRARFQQLCWLMWIGGAILIAGSWADAVRPEIGWIGFAIAAAGTIFSMLLTGSPHPRDERVSEEWD